MAQKLTVKKVYDTIRDFVYDTKRGCNFLAKKAKKGCMTQKCMTQNVRPSGGRSNRREVVPYVSCEAIDVVVLWCALF